MPINGFASVSRLCWGWPHPYTDYPQWVLFSALASLHVELILAVLLLVVSVPSLAKSFTLKTPQSLALLGMAVAVFLSVLVGASWLGGATPGSIIGRYREHVAANTKRLTAI